MKVSKFLERKNYHTGHHSEIKHDFRLKYLIKDDVDNLWNKKCIFPEKEEKGMK